MSGRRGSPRSRRPPLPGKPGRGIPSRPRPSRRAPKRRGGPPGIPSRKGKAPSIPSRSGGPPIPKRGGGPPNVPARASRKAPSRAARKTKTKTPARTAGKPKPKVAARKPKASRAPKRGGGRNAPSRSAGKPGRKPKVKKSGFSGGGGFSGRFNFTDEGSLPAVPEFQRVKKQYIKDNENHVCPDFPEGGYDPNDSRFGEQEQEQAPAWEAPATSAGPPAVKAPPTPARAANKPKPKPVRAAPKRSPAIAPRARKAPKRATPKPKPARAGGPPKITPRRGGGPPVVSRKVKKKKKKRGGPPTPARGPGGGGGGDGGGGGEDFDAQIAELDAEMKNAIANQEFEKCGPLRDKIKKLKAKKDAQKKKKKTFPKLDFKGAQDRLQEAMNTALANEEYELCAPLRNTKKKLSGLESKWKQGQTQALYDEISAIIDDT